MPLSRALLLLPLVLVVATPAAAAPSVRMEGKWRVSYDPSNYAGRDVRDTWKMAPKCASGACSVRVRTKADERLLMRFDSSFGDYRGVQRTRTDCVDKAGDVLVEDAYRAVIRWSFKPTVAATVGNKLVASKAKGERRTTLKPTDAGADEARCVKASVQVDKMAMVAQ